jgi:hypothetical protein
MSDLDKVRSEYARTAFRKPLVICNDVIRSAQGRLAVESLPCEVTGKERPSARIHPVGELDA